MSGKKELTYLESVHRDGRAWGLLLFFLILFGGSLAGAGILLNKKIR